MRVVERREKEKATSGRERGGRYKRCCGASPPWAGGTRRRESRLLPNSKSNLPGTVISGFPGGRGAVGQRDSIPKHPYTGENMEHVCETRCFGRVCRRRPMGPHCGEEQVAKQTTPLPAPSLV